MDNVDFILIFIIIILSIMLILQYAEIKRINSKIQLLEGIRSTLYKASEKISKANSVQDVYDLILDTAIELVPNVSKGSILLLGEDNLFHFNTIRGFSEELKSLTLRKEEAYLYTINNFSETAIIKAPYRFDKEIIDSNKIQMMKEFQSLDIKCTLSSPIYMDEKLIGLINLDSMVSDKAFHKEDIDLMNHIKCELQLALNNLFIQNKLKYMANFDELTGLFNRRYFKQFFNKELSRIKRYKTQGCLALIDLDNFKDINDTYGHNEGDKALKFFADVLRENIRSSDVYARMSGDEFVILFVNCSKEKAVERLEGVRDNLLQRKFGTITLGFSYGVCKIDPDSSVTPDDIFGAADKEMYRDKYEKENRNKNK